MIRMMWLKLITIVFALSISLTAVAATSPYFTPEKVSSLIHQYLSERYQISDYKLYTSDEIRLATFTLSSGAQLTYGGGGQLLEKKTADGQLVLYEHGFPIRILQQGKITSETHMTWNHQNKLEQSLTKTKNRETKRFYQEGKLDLEIDQNDEKLVVRQGFNFSTNGALVTYFETNNQDGLTNWIKVNKYTGLFMEQYRVTGGVAKDIDEEYLIFRDLIVGEIEGRYAERRKLRQDSFDQTKGDILIPELKKGRLYSIEDFKADKQNKKIVVDPFWNYIDCTDVVVVLPKVSLVPLKDKVIKKARVKNKQVFYWDKKINDWAPYHYDPSIEKIVPLGIGNQVMIEPRFKRDQWQLDRNGRDYYVINRRLIIDQVVRDQQKKRTANLSYLATDPNDFKVQIDAEKINYAKAKASVDYSRSEYQLGQKATFIDKQLLHEFQLALTARQKQRIKQRHEGRTKDVHNITKRDFLINHFIAEQIITAKELNAQKHKLFIKEIGPLRQVTYKALKIKQPIIEKKKIYTYYRQVKMERGVIKVWQEDHELQEKGYWQLYTLRPYRDRLINTNGQLTIQSNQGHFQWVWKGRWTTDLVSGKLYLPGKRLEKSKELSEEISRAITLRNRVETHGTLKTGIHDPASLLTNKKQQLNLIQRWWIKMFQTVQITTASNGAQLITSERKNWLRQVSRIEKAYQQLDGSWHREIYDQYNRIIELSNSLQEDYQFDYSKYDQHGQILIKQNNPSGLFQLKYEHDALVNIVTESGLTKTWAEDDEMSKVQLGEKNNHQLLASVYDNSGKIKQHHIFGNHRISYSYLADDVVRLEVKSRSNKHAWLKFNKQGKLLDKGGEKRLINIIFINYNWFRPTINKKIYNRIVSK